MNGYFYKDDEIFSTTIHETAHLTHNILLGLNSFSLLLVHKEIVESWAVAVEWWLTGLEYKSRGITDYGGALYNPSNNPPGYPNIYGYQYWSLGYEPDYTSLFINLLDNNNELGQYFTHFGITGTVDDRIGTIHPGFKDAYTISNLENQVIRFSPNLATVRDKLKNHKPSAITDSYIDILMNFY